VSQEKKPKKRKFVCEATTVLDSQCFWHEKQVESKKESLELEHPWREIYRACWRIYRDFWS
jgi:hypothetical protein